MKKSCFLFPVFCFLFSVSCFFGVAQPTMKLAHTTHNFKQVARSNGPQSHVFEFTNTGDEPLVILRMDTSCGCVDATYPRRPVAPGDKGEITITYDPKGQKGTFMKAMQVYTNERPGRHIISVQGEVVK